MQKTKLVLGTIILLVVMALALAVFAQDTGDDERYVGKVEAPEYPSGLDWLNVDAPLTIAGLEDLLYGVKGEIKLKWPKINEAHKDAGLEE